MTLVIIFGPPAVGKMAVGMELERQTGFRLFHNHMSVDPVMRLFPFESPAYSRLVGEFRRRVFEEFSASDERGLIFTFVWAVDDEQDRRFVEATRRQEVRLWRNETPLRLAEKRSQRDIVGTRAFLLEADRRYRLNSADDFPYPDRHLKIDNTDLTPEAVASRIVKRVGLPVGNIKS
jgi:DNA polymerase III delta prime subunit